MISFNVIYSYCRRFLFFRYSILVQMALLVVIINPGYSYFEHKVMKVRNEANWIVSPDGKFRARIELKAFPLKAVWWFVRLKVESRKDARDWFEVVNVKVFSPPVFTRFTKERQDIGIWWMDKDRLRLRYFEEYIVEVPFEMLHTYYCQFILK